MSLIYTCERCWLRYPVFGDTGNDYTCPRCYPKKERVMKARDVKPGLLSWRGTLVSKTIMGQYLRVSDGVFVVIPDEDIVYPVEAVANADLFGVSAAVIAPSMTTWVVTCKHGHRTLELGDEVRMVEDPEYRNWLLRLRDSTMHRLQDTSGQYLLLKMKP